MCRSAEHDQWMSWLPFGSSLPFLTGSWLLGFSRSREKKRPSPTVQVMTSSFFSCKYIPFKFRDDSCYKAFMIAAGAMLSRNRDSLKALPPLVRCGWEGERFSPALAVACIAHYQATANAIRLDRCLLEAVAGEDLQQDSGTSSE